MFVCLLVCLFENWSSDQLIALTNYILRTRKKYLDKKVIKLLYAAGKTIDEIKVPKYVKKSKLDLKSISTSVRKDSSVGPSFLPLLMNI